MTQVEIITLYFIRLLKDNSELILPVKAKLPILKEYLTNELSVRDIAMMVMKSSRKDETLKNNLKEVLINKEIEFPESEELLLKKYSTEAEKIENVFKIPLADAIDQYLSINGHPSEEEMKLSLNEEKKHRFVQKKRKRQRGRRKKKKKSISTDSSSVTNIQ